VNSENARTAKSPIHTLVVVAFVSLALGISLLANAGLAQPDASEFVYRLGPGDKLRVIVFGEEDLSGEFVVDGSGYIRLPLVGQVQAANRTVYEFERDVETKLKDGYLKAPRVSAEVMNYRPFYIIGEVGKPGEYPYVNGMSVLNAVALAGGYTYRANERNVYLRRYGDSREQSVPADETTKVYPGDIIRVVERFF
jgi:polysaccharide export outer membrane protein